MRIDRKFRGATSIQITTSGFRDSVTDGLSPGRVARLADQSYHFLVIHNLPPVQAFQDAKPTDRIQEIALRVVVELPDWKFHVAGTGILIADHLAITAGHVLDWVLDQFGRACELVLYQVLPGPVYVKWTTLRPWRCSTDAAILQLAPNPTVYGAADLSPVQKVPRLRVSAPAPGERVVAFGYRKGEIQVTEDAEGVHHIELNDLGSTSIGEVVHVHPIRRDSALANFPCFEVRARFDRGMSGGLVVDGGGNLCGLVCSGYDLGDPEEVPISYATTLWPILTTLISADRGDKYPRGVSYPAIDLALDGLIHVIGLEDVDPTHFPGRVLPRTRS
jgi:hypothetical protein